MGLRARRIPGSDNPMSHEYTLIVYTSPVEGREDDYNAWYDDVHLAEFAALPGVISGRRFQVTSATPDGKPTYAAVYELSSHPDDVVKGMNKAIKDGSMHMTDAVDGKSVTMTHLKPC
jgi:hypothetical protein